MSTHEQLSLFASEMGKIGGQSRSPEKVAAARENGKLGGRPVTPVINRDGFSVAGCTYIYAPTGQAGEYAKLATNPYRGCGHRCVYCYVPNILSMDRAEFDGGAIPRPDFLNHLTQEAKKYRAAGITEQVMLSFTTDPFNPLNVSLTRPTIEILIQHGLAFCTLTKGGSRALPFIDLFRPTRDAFAVTLTSLDDSVSLRWERAAALPGDRLETLRQFHRAGVFTWVSLEPTLDTATSLRIIRETHSYVDLYKIGRANYLPMTSTTDWRRYTLQIVELCHKLEVKHYIKRDLQPYLPADYQNARYIVQHN